MIGHYRDTKATLELLFMIAGGIIIAGIIIWGVVLK